MKTKLRAIGVHTLTDRVGNKRKVIVASPTGANDPCKNCKKNERRDGSSICQRCSDTYKKQLLIDSRLARKIENQTKQNQNV